MLKIEVRYKKLGPNHYHKYIVYTNQEGYQYATRGGPEHNVGGGASGLSTAESGSSDGVSYGKIVTKTSDYSYSVDYDEQAVA